METRERLYGVECFDNLNSNQLENESMGIYVDIKTERMSSLSTSGDSDNDLTIRRSVDEELALSNESCDEDDAVQQRSYHVESSSSDRTYQVSQLETMRNSDSENEDSDDDLNVNVSNIPTNGVELPLNNKPRRPLSSCSSYSSEPHSDVMIDVSDSSDDDSRERSPYSCQYCRKEFRSNADLTRHVRCHTGERPYNCDHCSKSFSQSAHLRRHLLTHPDKATEHKCSVCDKSYPLKIQLIGHMAVHSKKEPVTKVKTKYKCEYCQKTLSTLHKYKKHVLAHKNGNLHCCDVCGRSFKMQSYLIVHKRTHTQTKVYTGDRPFVCTECGKGFLSSSNLELHATIHKYERTSFPCEICGKEFSRKSNFVAHSKAHYR